MFVFTVGTAGLRIFFRVEIFNGVNFFSRDKFLNAFVNSLILQPY